nr:RNB domain-containing ribonuclease [Salsipaludibacter albus]
MAAGLSAEGPVPGRELGGLDWRDAVVVTIDDDRSRDLDDALSAAWDGDPETPVDLYVHIADPAGAVGIDSPADRYAATMGTTTYLAVGGNAPMLDPALSEDLVSLLPGEERGALTVSCRVGPDGQLDDVTLSLSVIRSTARLSYAAVDAFLDDIDQRELLVGAHGPSGADQEHVEMVAANVAALAEASRRLGVERDARDSLDSLFEPARLEAAIVDGKIRAIEADPHPRAQQVVERLMVAANEAVAGWAVEHDVDLLFRSHLGFDPDRVDRITTAASAAGVELPDPPRPLDVLSAVAELRAADRIPDADLLATAAAGAVARAGTSAEPSGHEGLAAAAYTQFTSPIRRYTDLVVHRQVRAALADEPAPYDRDRLAALAGWLDARAGAAGHAQALERNALWSVLLERGAVSWPATAVVTGLTPAGARVRIPEAGVSGLVPANRLDAERRNLQVSADGTQTSDGSVRLGQRLSVRLDRLDALGRPDFRPA